MNHSWERIAWSLHDPCFFLFQQSDNFPEYNSGCSLTTSRSDQDKISSVPFFLIILFINKGCWCLLKNECWCFSTFQLNLSRHNQCKPILSYSLLHVSPHFCCIVHYILRRRDAVSVCIECFRQTCLWNRDLFATYTSRIVARRIQNSENFW